MELPPPSDSASMAHYRTAGAMLLEAKAQVPHGEWKHWVDQNFHLSHNTAKIYMQLAAHGQKANALAFSSLGEFVRETSNPNFNKPHTVRPTPWHAPVKQAMDDQELVERIRRDTRPPASTVAPGTTIRCEAMG